MIPSLAVSAASAASQMLSSLMSALSPTSSSDSSSTASASAMAMTGATPTPSDGSNALTGSATGTLSGEILTSLMALQQQSGDASPASATSSSASSDPLQQLFSAMDTNGDGSVSQGEMESYIEGIGGTQTQADSLYSALSQNGASSSAAASTGTAGISESQMSGAVSQAQAAHHGGGGHHHHKAGGSSDSATNALLQALDTNDDGSVSQDELTNFVTANGGTATDAANDFAALDSSGSGSLTSADFATAWSNMQAQQTSQSSGTMVMSLLDAFTKASGGASSSASTMSISA